ncbi:hypothetical protein JessAGP_023 [Caulobacter phage Jess A]|nr:hypothetical protein JessAGP_023 [Caulobacter phage Jess A]QNH91675.1 hypothetical protein SR18_gp024 [Caulobacter phage SR18]WCA46432.1 hypothetical protein [Caulobacter phage RapA]WCD56208.1 hypothetical protein [Caulobacter phage BL94]
MATAEIYERAIQRAEQTFRRNKSRMWVLKILREYIAQGEDRARALGDDIDDALAGQRLEDQP